MRLRAPHRPRVCQAGRRLVRLRTRPSYAPRVSALPNTPDLQVVTVSVIVPAHNAERFLPDLLRALSRQELDDDYEVVVVDDNSTDRTAELVEAQGHPFRLVRAAGSQGAGKARNVGAASATGSVLAFTDADCMPAPDWLAKACLALADADLVQGAVLPDPAGDRSSPYARSLEVTWERGFYETANLIVRRTLFEAIGGFEDHLPALGGRPQGEDTLFGWQARRRGARVTFCSEAVVHHAVIPQSASEWIRDRWRWQLLPALVSRVPELRANALYRRWFFEHRTASFDVALCGVVAAGLLRRPAPLVLTLRWVSLVVEESSRLPMPDAVTYPFARLAADTVSFAALARGSWAAREIVL